MTGVRLDWRGLIPGTKTPTCTIFISPIPIRSSPPPVTQLEPSSAASLFLSNHGSERYTLLVLEGQASWKRKGNRGKKKQRHIYLSTYFLLTHTYIYTHSLFLSALPFCFPLLFLPLDGGFTPAFLVLGCAGWSDGVLFRFCIIVI